MEIYEVEETNKGGGVLIVIMAISGLFTCVWPPGRTPSLKLSVPA
jgi:hypothetical protein